MPHFYSSLLDITGSIFAFFCTLFYIKASPLAWPVGLVAIICDGILFTTTGIYGDAALEIFYFLSTFYGWYLWLYGSEKRQAIPITNLSWRHGVTLTFVSLAATLVLVYFLKYSTNSQVPVLDGITTVLSLAAQWLTCRKIIESWFLWFVVDSLYVGLYVYKGIPAHSILLMIYLLLAVIGYFHWRKLQGFDKIVVSVPSV